MDGRASAASTILRAPDPEARERQREAFVEDSSAVARLIREASSARAGEDAHAPM
ncbi:hypothetical protein ACN47A_00070 [Myxococcus fulvus]|uniref:hypothetical protein n=1 Tax=Myxococcus fulvus TaxID=33 RepID=UPI003B9B2487